MIVVEGFDASGKSTLARRLAAEFGCELYHTGGPTQSVDDVDRCLRRSLSRMQTRCVQDRVTHVSEAVYGAMRHPDRAALALYRVGQLKAARVVIYCRPDDDALLQAFMTAHVVQTHDTDEHLAYVRAQAETLIKLYDVVIELVRRHMPHVYTYDRFVAGDTDRIIDVATRFMP